MSDRQTSRTLRDPIPLIVAFLLGVALTEMVVRTGWIPVNPLTRVAVFAFAYPLGLDFVEIASGRERTLPELIRRD